MTTERDAEGNRLVKVEVEPAAHGDVRPHADAPEPRTQGLRRRPQIVHLGRQAFLRAPAEQVGVVGASVVGDEHDLPQLVSADQEVEPFPDAPAEAIAGAARQETDGAAGNRPAVVAWDQQMAMAELVEGLAPAAVMPHRPVVRHCLVQLVDDLKLARGAHRDRDLPPPLIVVDEDPPGRRPQVAPLATD